MSQVNMQEAKMKETVGNRQVYPEVEVKGERRQFSPAYKQRIVEEAGRCPNGEVGGLLRREGLYGSHLNLLHLITRSLHIAESVRTLCSVGLAMRDDHTENALISQTPLVTVGRRVAPPPAASKPCLPVSWHTAPQCISPGHGYINRDCSPLMLDTCTHQARM